MKQFNTNWQLSGWIASTIAPRLALAPLVAYRGKASGAMMRSGEYSWGPYVVDDDGHYQGDSDERQWSLRRYRDTDAHWHLAKDNDGKVWFSPAGFFSSPIESLTDWELTEMELD